MSEIVRHTASVCPVCLERLPADIVKTGHEYFLEKTCLEHGRFSAVVWRGENPAFEKWGDYQPPRDIDVPDCPNDCGLCAGHRQKTCCALVEVTNRCNLSCPVCFASSGGIASEGNASRENTIEPSVGELFHIFKELADNGNTFVQLSGGEPTVRDDLPEIIAAAKAAGCESIQLNSNGLRLGEDPGYTRALSDAGLSFVFMQFDGTEDAIYEKLRGQQLLDQKKAAIRVCGENRLGVTLVPTVVPGVNDHNLGDIVTYAISRSPAVRGVHFQPISYFGRYPKAPDNKDRITLPEILRAVEAQTGGKVKITDFAPSCCDHPRCGFHGDFVVLPNRTLLRLTPKSRRSSCCDDTSHLKNRNFVARRWKRSEEDNAPADAVGKAEADFSDMDTFLRRVKSHGFTLTAMAFQDAYTLDIERLRMCSLHVARDGRVIPFCANYITPYDELA
ncbi:MAG: radical SAM protein [Clostridiales bacterium]|nr:radical SAM protein [Clostridiales bacterium]